jgi:hypothetical protein
MSGPRLMTDAADNSDMPESLNNNADFNSLWRTRQDESENSYVIVISRLSKDGTFLQAVLCFKWRTICSLLAWVDA